MSFRISFVLSSVFLSLCLCVLRSSLVHLKSNREAAKEGVQEWEVARAGVAAMQVLYHLEFQRIFNLETENFYGGTHLTYIGLANEALKYFIQANIAEKAGEKAELMDTWVWFQVAIIFTKMLSFL